jgi:pimeloyl-ACP methyl ester carboxylesterase
VRDADALRAALYGQDASWHVFGQSFGGFCVLTYLSVLPDLVAAAIITGGFAPVLHDAEGTYRTLAERMAERNRAYFARFPVDAGRVRRVVDHLQSTADVDATGHRLTAHRFLALGEYLGHTHGMAQLHAIIERASNDLDQLGVLGGLVHRLIGELMSPSTNPIYSVLHEPCYSSGPATNWAASRVTEADARFALDAQPAPYLTGEMIFPWMFEELAPLRPLRDAAGLIAKRDGWPALYDVERLRANRVPVAGTVYWNDPYVERGLALETASLLGTCDVWITNEHEHGAYRMDPKRVGKRLFAMLDQLRAAA